MASSSPKNTLLESQAATAALYVTHPSRSKVSNETYPLDRDQKLSSAGAATSLKYASPKSLPSFPVLGLQDGQSSAGTAATLANVNKSSFQHWKPDASAAASAAAILAKDYKSPGLWQPEMTIAGSRAAILAHRGVSSTEAQGAEKADSAIPSSPGARRTSGTSVKPSNKALMAATGAFSNSRKRSDSTPTPRYTYPDSSKANSNALNAAAAANRPSRRSFGNTDGDQVANLNVNNARLQELAKSNVAREMYSSNPPVAIEVEEKRRQDVLRAAAISMAKQMYEVQQKTIRDATATSSQASQLAATISNANHPPEASDFDGEQRMKQQTSLEESARRLAADRLSKLHDEHSAYRSYYGTAPQQHRTLLSRTRRRAASDGRYRDDDVTQSRRIRSEMTLFSDKLAEVDAKKRQKDRETLLAAAQRKVKADMETMDQKVFADTGKVPPSVLAEWESKAAAKARADSDARMSNYGKVDIGGGRFLNQADVDAVALRNVQPVLNEINEKAEKERARVEGIRLEEDHRKKEAAEEKARDRGIKAEQKRIKEEEKQAEKRKREEDKQAERQRRDEERSRKLEGKRIASEEKRRPKDSSAAKVEDTIPRVTNDEEIATVDRRESHEDKERLHQDVLAPREKSEDSPAVDVDTTPQAIPIQGTQSKPAQSSASPPSDSKLKGWLKGKFRRSSKPYDVEPIQKEPVTDSLPTMEHDGKVVKDGEQGTGDHELEIRESSMKDVALASEQHKKPASIVSSVSSVSVEEGQRGRLNSAQLDGSHNDEFEEARDRFDDALAPPSFGAIRNASASPTRDSKFKEEL